MQQDIAVEVSNVSKRYGTVEVLSGVSLSVHRKEVVVIIGPSGAGKSTLLRCVNYLVPFEEGSIEVLGMRLSGLLHSTAEDRKRMSRALPEIRGRVGMVFQSFNLFPHLTALDNVTLAPRNVRKIKRDEAEGRAIALLERVGLKGKERAYPRQLSGGQQQRVAICRALAMDPQVMLFDEVTSALDPELVGEVLSVLRELAREGMTMMIVTHEMLFARDVADTVVVMADGQIVEQGQPAELFNSPREPRTRAFLRRVLDEKGDLELGPIIG